MRVRVELGALAPMRENASEGWMYIRAMEDQTVRAGMTEVIRTGIHIEHGWHRWAFVQARKMLLMRMSSRGVIDAGNDGEVRILLTNHNPETMIVPRGTAIAGIMMLPDMFEPAEVVDSQKGRKRKLYGKRDQGSGIRD